MKRITMMEKRSLRVTQIEQLKQDSQGDFIQLVTLLRGIGVDGFSMQTDNLQCLYRFNDGEQVIVDSNVSRLDISEEADISRFILVLKKHQVGELDFMAWREQIAHCGVDYWLVDLVASHCQYFGIDDQLLYTESFPSN